VKVAKYFGDDRLRNRVIYTRNSYSECVYCGNEANTREHVPSKTFLAQPFPADLSTVPACLTCNNSYSDDELFLSLLIQMLKQRYYGSDYNFSPETSSKMARNVRAVRDINTALDNNDISYFHPQISRVLTKLAIGHSVYELADGYFTDDDGVTPDSASVRYDFLNNRSQEEVNEFMGYFDITNEVMPEVGSRVFCDRLLVLDNNVGERQFLLDWVNVQKSEYTYTCFKFGNEIVVKMVINDFLFAEIILKEEF